jgi:hypothetical protein
MNVTDFFLLVYMKADFHLLHNLLNADKGPWYLILPDTLASPLSFTGRKTSIDATPARLPHFTLLFNELFM